MCRKEEVMIGPIALIVDDDPRSAELLSMLLKAGGYQTAAASYVKTASEAIQHDKWMSWWLT